MEKVQKGGAHKAINHREPVSSHNHNETAKDEV